MKTHRITPMISAVLLLVASTGYADSRLNKKKKSPEPLLSEELTIKKVVKLPFGRKNAAPQCEVELELRYSQAHTSVRTTTDVKVIGCSDAKGEYRHRVRTVGANGEPNTEEYTQAWSAKQSNPASGELRLQQSQTYDLKGDPDLRWVRINTRPKTRCLCLSKQPSEASADLPTDLPADLPTDLPTDLEDTDHSTAVP